MDLNRVASRVAILFGKPLPDVMIVTKHAFNIGKKIPYVQQFFDEIEAAGKEYGWYPPYEDIIDESVVEPRFVWALDPTTLSNEEIQKMKDLAASAGRKVFVLPDDPNDLPAILRSL